MCIILDVNHLLLLGVKKNARLCAQIKEKCTYHERLQCEEKFNLKCSILKSVMSAGISKAQDVGDMFSFQHRKKHLVKTRDS